MAKRIDRRELLRGGMLSATTLGLSPALARPGGPSPESKKRLKVVAVGAHPDDPETGCGGTLLRYAQLGHSVHILYLTKGEAGIEGRAAADAAATRTEEAQRACALLKARPLFAGQIDGQTEVNPARYDAFAKVLLDERPDVVFTHWPLDSQRDHRAASVLVYDAWLKARRSFPLYYFEVLTGMQTQAFHPTDYVDITAVEPTKRAACFAHLSQDPARFYPLHEAMHAFRGMEHGVKLAEAFLRHDKGPTGMAGL